MKKIKNPYLIATLALLFSFALFVILVIAVDAQPIGLEETEVGLATLNGAVKDGVNPSDSLHKVTEVLGYVAIAIAICFAGLGVFQLFKRKHLRLVDKDLIALAGVYAAVAVCYLFFEMFPLNYRPKTPDGSLEASFPSTHTLLFLTIAATAAIYLCNHVKSRPIRIAIVAVASVLGLVMTIGRLLSGVHWFTDIIGGVLLSATIILAYLAALKQISLADK